MRTFWISATFLAVGGLSVVAWNRNQDKETAAVTESPSEDENENDDLQARLARLEHLAGRSVAAAITSPGITKATGEPEAEKGEAPREGGAAPEALRTETPQETAATVVGELTQSGPPQADWTSRVQSTLDGWKAKSSLGTKVALGDMQCFARGCTFVATYADRNALDRVNDDMRASEPFERLNAPSFLSGPVETQTGQLQVVWVLYSQEQS